MFPMYPALSYRTPGYRPENKPRSYPRLGDTSKPDRREVPIAATRPTGHVQATSQICDAASGYAAGSKSLASIENGTIPPRIDRSILTRPPSSRCVRRPVSPENGPVATRIASPGSNDATAPAS